MPWWRGTRALLAAGLASAGLVANAEAATYVVDRDSIGGPCSDARPAVQATSATTPWCSLDRAIAAAPAGGTVAVRAGSHPPLSVTNAGHFLTLRPHGSERVVLQGLTAVKTAFLRLEGLELGRTVIGHGTHNVALAGGRIVGGVVIQDGVHDVAIEDNEILAPTGSGVHFSSGYAEPEIWRVAIRRNRFDDIGVVGVNARNFRDLVIDDNEFQGVHSWNGVVHPDVIRTYHGGTGLVVRRNFIHDNRAQGFFIKDGLVTDVTFENNVVTRTEAFHGLNIYDVQGLKLLNNTIHDSAVFQGDARAVVMKNNIVTSLNRTGTVDFAYEDFNYIAGGNLRGTGEHDLHSGLRFVDPAGLDFRLEAGSAGIDAGTSFGTPDADRLGAPRVDDPFTPNLSGELLSFYDLGAHEYGSEPPVPAPGPKPFDPPGPAGPRPAGPPSAAAPAHPEPGFAPAVLSARLHRSDLRRGRLVLRASSPEPCTVEASARLGVRGPSATSRSRVLRRPVGPRPVRLTLRLSRRATRVARTTLRRRGAVRVSVRLRAWNERGPLRTRSLRVRAKR